MSRKERAVRLARGLFLLFLGQVGYTLAVIAYQDVIHLMATTLALVCGIWGLAVLWPLEADYRRALVVCLVVQIGLGLLCIPLDRYVLAYLVIRVAMYVGTFLQVWLICSAAARDMGELGQPKLQARGALVKKAYAMELAGRSLNLASMFLGAAISEGMGIALGGLVVLLLAAGNLFYLLFLWQSRQAARAYGAEPMHL